MTPFERHLRIEITKQANRVKVLEGDEAERCLLRALVNTYDEYQKLKERRIHVALCVCCNAEPVKDENEMCAQCQMAEAEYREER